VTNVIPEITNAVAIGVNTVGHEITGLEVVKSVNEFYSTAFDHLLSTLQLLAIILGIVIPAIYYGLARIELNLSKRKLEKKLTQKLTQKFEALGKNLQEETGEKLKALETLIKKEANNATAIIFYVAAKNSEDAGRFKEALNLDVQAIKHGVLSSNFTGVQTFIRYTTKSVLSKMNKEHFSDVQFVSEIEAVMKSAGAANPLLQIDVDAFNAALEKAKNLDK
jgi:hypothetical protein